MRSKTPREAATANRNLSGYVPDRHLNALLDAENAAGIRIDERCIENHTRAAFFSYSGPVPLPLNRQDIDGSLVNFVPHNLREGFHALYTLIKYRGSARARELAEASIAAVFEYWSPDRGWDDGRLTDQMGLNVWREGSTSPEFITGVARSIGPLVKLYRVTGHVQALQLAILLKEKAIAEAFTEEGTFDPAVFGDHVHSTTCTMSSLDQLADFTGDSVLMRRVKAFLTMASGRCVTSLAGPSNRPRLINAKIAGRPTIPAISWRPRLFWDG